MYMIGESYCMIDILKIHGIKINYLHTNMLIFKFLKDDGVPKQSKIPMLPKSNGILT